MSTPPPVNPNVHNIADRAKHAYATGTQLLAETQYRLAELAGTGLLDAEESMRLQHNLVRIWEELYFGTLCAVRDENTHDATWDEADNTYSDGRQVKVGVRIEPWETSECSWEHNPFALGDGAVNEHPRGTICYIAPVDPADEIVTDPSHQPTSTDFGALRRRLMEATFDPGDDQDLQPPDGDDEVK